MYVNVGSTAPELIKEVLKEREQNKYIPRNT